MNELTASEAFTPISTVVFDRGAIMSEVPHANSGTAITLYRLQACPFCERAVRKLNEYDLDYTSRFVEPMHSERDIVERISGKRTVPAIVDENTGVTMSESANIVEYLEQTYGPGADA
jgi:glutaredoxin